MLRRYPGGQHVDAFGAQPMENPLERFERFPLAVNHFGKPATAMPVEIKQCLADIGDRPLRQAFDELGDGQLATQKLLCHAGQVGGFHKVNRNGETLLMRAESSRSGCARGQRRFRLPPICRPLMMLHLGNICFRCLASPGTAGIRLICLRLGAFSNSSRPAAVTRVPRNCRLESLLKRARCRDCLIIKIRAIDKQRLDLCVRRKVLEAAAVDRGLVQLDVP